MTPVLEIVAKVCFLAYMFFFVYGVIRYPDAPIRPCGADSYCGKQGQLHDRGEYEGFQLWEGAMPWVLVLFFLGLAYLNREPLMNAINRK
jgi:hypothetical protein